LAEDGEQGWDCVKAFDYDLMLLDVMLPEIDGIALCQRLRSHGYQMPVLMITARDTISDKITGLDVGADDYIVKPIDLGELFARIRALVKRQLFWPVRVNYFGRFLSSAKARCLAVC